MSDSHAGTVSLYKELTQFILAVLSSEHCWTVTAVIDTDTFVEAVAISTAVTLCTREPHVCIRTYGVHTMSYSAMQTIQIVQSARADMYTYHGCPLTHSFHRCTHQTQGGMHSSHRSSCRCSDSQSSLTHQRQMERDRYNTRMIVLYAYPNNVWVALKEWTHAHIISWQCVPVNPGGHGHSPVVALQTSPVPL